MDQSNKMSEDVILFLEENGFGIKRGSNIYFKLICVDSVEVLATVFFNAERQSYDSAYLIHCWARPFIDKEQRLDSFELLPNSVHIPILKKLVSNIHTLCKNSLAKKSICYYRMDLDKHKICCRDCNACLPKELYK